MASGAAELPYWHDGGSGGRRLGGSLSPRERARADGRGKRAVIATRSGREAEQQAFAEVAVDAAEMNSVLGKAKLILEAFSAEDNAVSLTELVRRTGIAKATMYRLAQELLRWGMLERAGTDYRLGLRLFEIGQRVPRQRILREAALPYMEDLLLATKETIHFAVQDGLDVLYIEKIIMHQGLSKQSRVAGRLPLYCTATGKVFLAYSGSELIADVVRACDAPDALHDPLARSASPPARASPRDEIRNRARGDPGGIRKHGCPDLRIGRCRSRRVGDHRAERAAEHQPLHDCSPRCRGGNRPQAAVGELAAQAPVGGISAPFR